MLLLFYKTTKTKGTISRIRRLKPKEKLFFSSRDNLLDLLEKKGSRIYEKHRLSQKSKQVDDSCVPERMLNDVHSNPDISGG
jgi:hypothetical protein